MTALNTTSNAIKQRSHIANQSTQTTTTTIQAQFGLITYRGETWSSACRDANGQEPSFCRGQKSEEECPNMCRSIGDCGAYQTLGTDCIIYTETSNCPSGMHKTNQPGTQPVTQVSSYNVEWLCYVRTTTTSQASSDNYVDIGDGFLFIYHRFLNV